MPDIVKVSSRNISGLFSHIYASSYKNLHKFSLKNIKIIKDNYCSKWLIGEDFKELLHNSRRAGKSS